MKKKEMPTYKLVILLVIAVLLSIGVTSWIYSFYKILNYTEYPISLNIAEKNQIGFNLNPGVLSFGKVPQGATAIRNATVSQRYPFDVLVRIEITGKVKQLVFVKENLFILPSNITKTIEVVASVPENQTTGNYTGKLKVYFERQ